MEGEEDEVENEEEIEEGSRKGKMRNFRSGEDFFTRILLQYFLFILLFKFLYTPVFLIQFALETLFLFQ